MYEILVKELLSIIKKLYEAVTNLKYFQKKLIEKKYTKIELGFLYENFFERNWQYLTYKFQSCEAFYDSLPSGCGNDLSEVNEMVEHIERLVELQHLKYELINKCLKIGLLNRTTDTEEREKNCIGQEYFDSFDVKYKIDDKHREFSNLREYFESKSYEDFPEYKHRYYKLR